MLDSTSLNLLLKTHFNHNQAAVYLATLQQGQATVSKIAQLAELKRPLTYIVLSQLEKDGYVSQVPGYKNRRYSAVDPNALATQLDQTARDFKEMLPYLRSTQRKAGKPYITYYSGKNAVSQAFGQIRKPKEARYITSIHNNLHYIPAEVDRWKSLYEQGKASKGGKHLLTDTTEDRTFGAILTQADEKVRYLPPNQTLHIDMALIDSTVYLTAFDADIHITVIESEAMYISMCIIFDLAWQHGTI
jgi:sugar-specific transcriptional regulator TrmB